MSKIATISSKGQVTIPVEVRNRLGVGSGDKVEFAFEGGNTIIRPSRDPESPFTPFIGALPVFKTKEEHDQWFREIRYGGDEPE